MGANRDLLPAKLSSLPIALYNAQQLYAIERAWFDQGYDSFGLMQQAAWQMAQYIIYHSAIHFQLSIDNYNKHPQASIWVGQGNNGGDGWLIAYYLQQSGWQVAVIIVGNDNLEGNKHIEDATKAQQIAVDANVPYHDFKDSDKANINGQAHVYIDALFGIGLDRAPKDIYKDAILSFNQAAKVAKALVIAVDIPSGLVASTGQVFDYLAVQADITLCLIARKFGLHTKDGRDYAGHIVDLPLIPYENISSTAILLTSAYKLSARRQNSYKGSYGHVLIIGGNQIDGSQGMGGAAILAASSAMATGAGKLTIACHQQFHGALLTSLADAMTIDLHDRGSVKNLIADASVIAIGMGLGRDDKAKALFISYLSAAIDQGCALAIDADGLYHLATLRAENHKLVKRLKAYSKTHQVQLSPHSGEAAKLLNKKITDIEADRLTAIKQCAIEFGGNWVLKGAGSLVLEQTEKGSQLYVCNVGNAGMATAGMGDILSGIIAGLLAQQDLIDEQSSLRQAVLIHGLAADILVEPHKFITTNLIASKFIEPKIINSGIGQRGLQAQDMPAAIRHVMQLLTI